MTVTIGQRGIFTLSGPAHELLGRPDAVEFLYDRDTRVVGVRPAVDRANAYSVRANGASFSVSGSAFIRHYGIASNAAVRRTASLQDDVLCVDLNDPGTPVTSNRAKSA